MEEKELFTKLNALYPGEIDKINRAYSIAKDAHKGQKRASGDDYILHPMEVVNILCDLKLDADAICAAFLHDVVEDTEVTLSYIEKEFGKVVADLVDGVTKLSHFHFGSEEDEQVENQKKMFLAVKNDIRVCLIKLADRLHNMRTLQYLSPERQLSNAKETLDIYAPLAGRLGISQIKCELEDLSLKYQDPEMYNFFEHELKEETAQRRVIIDKVIDRIKVLLNDSIPEFDVFGRPKHYYSIYKKMKKQGKSLEQIYDLIAVRIICNTIPECYSILGTIHTIWKPIPQRIKDFIAVPKANMYQSLHTTVATEYGLPVEIQIRTHEMHEIAEYGIAAHWKYKEGQKNEMAIDSKISELRTAIESQTDVNDSKEFIDVLKSDLFQNEVLVFTPKGDVISLCSKANVIDFAYAVHTAVGNKCVGAKVNGKMVPITTELVNGDVVEVVTSPTSKGPSLDWIKLAKSAGAKSKIKAFFKKEMREENIKLGKSMLNTEMRKRGYELVDVISDSIVKDLFHRYSILTEDELYSAVGFGGMITSKVCNKLVNNYKQTHVTQTAISPNAQARHNNGSGVIVEGHDDLLVRFAKCCSPVPGDPIVGFVSRGRGLCIHRADCPNMKSIEDGRLLKAYWANSSDYFNSELNISGQDEQGFVANILKISANSQIQVSSINAQVKEGKITVNLTVSVQNTKQVDDLIDKVKSYKPVYDVFRVK